MNEFEKQLFSALERYDNKREATVMENRDRLLKRDPLRLAVTRKSLKAIAECLADLDSADADRYLDTLIDELKMLRQRDTSSMAWEQVTSAITDGPRSYGLERIGLWPSK